MDPYEALGNPGGTASDAEPSPHVANANVKVAVRVRPPSDREREQGYFKAVSVDPLASSVFLSWRGGPAPQPRQFSFDHVADEAASQSDMFLAVGKPIADCCLRGYHCCLLAYGQTGAGKTFTMEGPDDENDIASQPGGIPAYDPQSNELRGMVPRILEYMFEQMEIEKQTSAVEYTIRCSYLQIYNEQVSDLLDPDSTFLSIREDAKRGTFVEGIQEVLVSTPEGAAAVRRRGAVHRKVGMTAMNMESSRSHSVFTLVVESQRKDNGGVMHRRMSRFYLVDLAGSERQKQSEATGARLKEAGSINKSLSALGNVIKALVDVSEGKGRHVPYRDSKLTFLLKDALGGNAKCTLVANVSPAEKNAEETLSTLLFVQRAKHMRNTASVNEDMLGNPAVMGEEIRRLRLEIVALRASASGPGFSLLAPGDAAAAAAAGLSLPSWTGQDSAIERVRRLELIVSASSKQTLAAERRSARQLQELREQVENSQDHAQRLQAKVQNLNLIVKLREAALAREKSIRQGSDEPGAESEEVRQLQEEVAVLRKMVEHHPDAIKFKMELDVCKARLAETQETLAAMAAQRGEGDATGSALMEELASLRSLNLALRAELDEQGEEARRSRAEAALACIQRDEVTTKMSSVEANVRGIADQAEAYRQEVNSTRQQHRVLQERLRDYEQARRMGSVAEARVLALEAQLAQKLEEVRQQEQRMEQQQKLEEEMLADLEKAETAREEATEELERLRTLVQSTRSNDTADAVRLAEQKARAAEERASNLSAQMEELRVQLALPQKAKEDAETEKRGITERTAGVESGLSRRVQELEDLLRTAEEESLQARNEKGILDATVADAEEERRQERVESEQLIRSLNEKIDAQAAREQAHLGEIAKLQDELAREKAMAAAELQAAVHEVRACEEKVAEVQAAHGKARGDLEAAQAELERMRVELLQAQADVAEKQTQLASLGVQLDEKEGQLTKLTADLEQTSQDAEATKLQLTEAAEELKHHLSRAHQEAEASQKQVQLLAARLEECEAGIALAQGEAQAAQEELRKKAAAEESARASTAAVVQAAQEAEAQAREALERAEEAWTKLVAQLKAVKRKAAALELVVVNFSDKVANLEAEAQVDLAKGEAAELAGRQSWVRREATILLSQVRSTGVVATNKLCQLLTALSVQRAQAMARRRERSAQVNEGRPASTEVQPGSWNLQALADASLESEQTAALDLIVHELEDVKGALEGLLAAPPMSSEGQYTARTSSAYGEVLDAEIDPSLIEECLDRSRVAVERLVLAVLAVQVPGSAVSGDAPPLDGPAAAFSALLERERRSSSANMFVRDTETTQGAHGIPSSLGQSAADQDVEQQLALELLRGLHCLQTMVGLLEAGTSELDAQLEAEESRAEERALRLDELTALLEAAERRTGELERKLLAASQAKAECVSRIKSLEEEQMRAKEEAQSESAELQTQVQALQKELREKALQAGNLAMKVSSLEAERSQLEETEAQNVEQAQILLSQKAEQHRALVALRSELVDMQARQAMLEGQLRYEGKRVLALKRKVRDVEVDARRQQEQLTERFQADAAAAQDVLKEKKKELEEAQEKLDKASVDLQTSRAHLHLLQSQRLPQCSESTQQEASHDSGRDALASPPRRARSSAGTSDVEDGAAKGKPWHKSAAAAVATLKHVGTPPRPASSLAYRSQGLRTMSPKARNEHAEGRARDSDALATPMPSPTRLTGGASGASTVSGSSSLRGVSWAMSGPLTRGRKKKLLGELNQADGSQPQSQGHSAQENAPMAKSMSEGENENALHPQSDGPADHHSGAGGAKGEAGSELPRSTQRGILAELSSGNLVAESSPLQTNVQPKLRGVLGSKGSTQPQDKPVRFLNEHR